MLFCSCVFILLFLPLTLAGYYVLLKRNVFLSRCYLLAASLVFYGYFNWRYLFILLSSLVVNFLFGRLLFAHRKKIILLAGILFNLLLLGYFKYYDFFLDTVNQLFRCDLALKHILLPLGISFYTFQQIAYLADIFHGKLKERYSPLTYALFICFFPQLVAGPIVLPGEMMPQFEDPSKRRFIPRNAAAGIFVFALGLAKKSLLADHFATAADALFAAAAPDAALTVAGTLSYAFQIYFDFSGYCDMAIGIALMFNIELPVNFLSPYRAADIRDFWRTWHVTLGRFLSEFIYFPLGGNRKGEWRTCGNLMVTFLISGLWHGAGWNFILWGALHGAATVVHRFWKEKLHCAMPKLCGTILTFAFVALAWIFFRAADMGEAKRVFAGFLRHSGAGNASVVTPENFAWMAAAFLIVFGLPPANTFAKRFRPCVLSWITALILLLVSLFSFAKYSPFIYFNF